MLVPNVLVSNGIKGNKTINLYQYIQLKVRMKMTVTTIAALVTTDSAWNRIILSILDFFLWPTLLHDWFDKTVIL